MKYLCVHCDKTFEHDEDEKKPRCPQCMRVNGLEKVGPAKKAGEGGERPSWLWWAVAGGVLVAAGVGYAWWAGQSADTVSGDVPLAALDRSATLGYLRARGVDARQLGTLLVPSEAVESWASEVAGDASGARAKAEAVRDAIRDRAEAGAFERWSFGVPRETPIAPPEGVLEMLAEDDALHHLYPLEVAALMASALRAEGVDAMVADVIRYPGDRSPPDPSGQLGYYVVAVYPGEVGEGEPTYYDPYGGREVQPEEARVLTDLEAVAAALSTRALHLLSRESEPERAMEASSQAIRLDGRSPSNRAVRGAILIAAGQAQEGLDELQSAKQLRPDAPRRNLLAGVHLAQQDLDAASREVAAALEETPDFAPGHATLAAIHLARGEADLARTELEEAERIDRQLHQLPQLWAMYYATSGDLERAVERAQQAVERNPDIQTRLMAARIYRQAARYGMMRREAHAVLERTPSQRQPEMREIIRRMLGPTALDPIDEEVALGDEPLEEGELDLGDPDSLRLDSPLLGDDEGGGGSTSLGGGGGGGGGPSLLGDDEGLQLGGGGGGLQLGGGGGGLQLGGGGGGDYGLSLGE
jgi:tetratricopeptide (TPR) repeat protein